MNIFIIYDNITYKVLDNHSKDDIRYMISDFTKTQEITNCYDCKWDGTDVCLECFRRLPDQWESK